MTDRVLSTDTARTSITRLQAITNGPLLEHIQVILREGTTLRDPSVWDGRTAQGFREFWQQHEESLRLMLGTITELRARTQQMYEDYITAGGNR